MSNDIVVGRSHDIEANDNRLNDGRPIQYGGDAIGSPFSSDNVKENEAQVSSITINTIEACVSSTKPNEHGARLSPTGINLNDLVIENDARIDGLQAETPLTSIADPSFVAVQKPKPVDSLLGGANRGLGLAAAVASLSNGNNGAS